MGSVVGSVVGGTAVGSVVGSGVGTSVGTGVGVGTSTIASGSLTVIVRMALPAALSSSVAVKVMIWLPKPREAEKLAPVPIWPLMDEIQTRERPRSEPSSGSFAPPLKKILSVVKNT